MENESYTYIEFINKFFPNRIWKDKLTPVFCKYCGEEWVPDEFHKSTCSCCGSEKK